MPAGFTTALTGGGGPDGTIDKAGKIGLWTKADSVTSFDELKVEAHDRR